jgi:hypothetical protein
MIRKKKTVEKLINQYYQDPEEYLELVQAPS